jgi:hypothetical protein
VEEEESVISEKLGIPDGIDSPNEDDRRRECAYDEVADPPTPGRFRADLIVTE